jgi:hypothetical protein
VLVHLGTHVAAVMEDHEPMGEIGDNDIVAHHLEGLPELLSLGELLQRRGAQHHDLLRVPAGEQRADIIIGGDVMLGRTIGDRISAGEDPFAGISEVLARAQLVLANLECVISTRGTPAAGKRFHFRAPKRAAAALRDFDAVSVANNHALDFGAGALRDTIQQLQNAGVAAVGGAPRVFGRVAVLGIDDTNAPANRDTIRRDIATAREQAELVVALVHWGDENTPIVNEQQRELARWLIAAGVDLIAGSHPHVVQPVDFYRGRTIVYSLGNLVFDGAPNVRSWNSAALLEVALAHRRGGSPTIRLIPVRLDSRGFPQLAVPQQTLAAETN